MNRVLDTIFHRWLRFPYTLHTEEFRSPKKPVETLVLIHGIGNSAQSWKDFVPMLPKNVRIIGVDLLGFGQSPKPQWAQYDARTQAKALAITLAGLKLRQLPILVGHSMGSLVAIEVARRYGLLVKELVLCSPPIYKEKTKKSIIEYDELLRELYRTAAKKPELLTSLSPIAVRLGFANKALSISEDNVEAYIAALSASIINQRSMQDLARLTTKSTIVYGTFDPVVIASNIKKVAKDSKYISVHRVIAGHEIIGGYTKSLAKILGVIIGQR